MPPKVRPPKGKRNASSSSGSESESTSSAAPASSLSFFMIFFVLSQKRKGFLCVHPFHDVFQNSPQVRPCRLLSGHPWPPKVLENTHKKGKQLNRCFFALNVTPILFQLKLPTGRPSFAKATEDKQRTSAPPLWKIFTKGAGNTSVKKRPTASKISGSIEPPAWVWAKIFGFLEAFLQKRF